MKNVEFSMLPGDRMATADIDQEDPEPQDQVEEAYVLG